jgi:L-alanine-DL-glutamate epimerase-like enolase superfamily enzyme
VKALQEVNLTWIEEPVWPPEDYASLRAVRDSGCAPVAAGENEYSPHGFEHMLRVKAVDVLQPSVSKLGITGAKRAAELASKAGVRMVPHSFYFGPALAATAHLLASLDEGHLIEFPFGSMPLLRDPLRAESGRVTVPSGPGLGIELNEKTIEAHTIAYRSLTHVS